MTVRNGRGAMSVCPTCGGRLDDVGVTGDPVAWVRRLAVAARRGGPPTRIREAHKVLDRLFALAPKERLRSIENEPERHTSRLLLVTAFARIERYFPKAPRQALNELETVHVLATLFDDATPGSHRFRAEAVARTWACKAAGFLGVADLFHANHAVRMARDLLRTEERIEGRLLAYLDRQEGRVRMYQHRFHEAERLLAVSARGFVASGELTEAARSFLDLAGVQRATLPDEALSTLAAAEKIIDPYAEPYLYLCCQMERALVLCDLGEGVAAELLVTENREVLQEFRDVPAVPLRATWLRGRIAFLLGDHDEAVAHFEKARRLALDQDNAYDAALVSLDLALVHLDRGDLVALREEAQAVVPILAGEGLHDAAAAALSLYRDALLRQQAGRALIHRLKSYFETARMTPDRKFPADGT